MDSDGGSIKQKAKAHADLVVVDRTALKELLSAVINTLKASENIEAMPPPEEGEAGGYEEARQAIASARTGLIGGIERIVAAVDELPSAVVKSRKSSG